MTTEAKILRVSATAAALTLAAAAGGPAQSIDLLSDRTPAVASSTRPEPLSDGVMAAIEEALQDEWQGGAMYERALKDHGDVRPFSNVVDAERRHAALLEHLLRVRGLASPTRPAEADSPASASVREACAAAVEFETKNAALYDRLLAAGPIPEDVKRAFEHNRQASLEHHKPAFERCAGIAAGPGRGAGEGVGPCRGCAAGCPHGRGCGGHVHRGCRHHLHRAGRS